MSGKWHLGLKRQHGPAARGFDRSFALLPGCANHYGQIVMLSRRLLTQDDAKPGYEPQYSHPEVEPHPFFETAVTALHAEDGEYLRSLPSANFYSSDFYAQRLIEYLEERTEQDKAKPFFAYLPFSAPHWPLQAPKRSVDKYRGFYNGGPQALREKRLQRMKTQGLCAHDVRPHTMVIGQGEGLDWADMTADERAKSARSMEVFAGMVDRMDENIGRVLDHLKRTGQYEDTCVLFMSDNGAEGASYEAIPLLGDQVMKHIEKYYDNSLENIGRSTSFLWYGSSWAQAATAPSRLYKMFSTEGGCRVPLVLKPSRTLSSGGFAAAGKITDSFCTVMDVVPTILELAGVSHPGTSYKGRKVESLRGCSWVPQLREVAGSHQEAGSIRFCGDDEVFGFEVAGSGALRKGKWKITLVPRPKGPQRWELFDIDADPGETEDLSAKMPVKMEEMLALWEEYKREVGVVGVAGEYDKPSAATDEFDDIGKWIRFIGKGREAIPEKLLASVPNL